MHSQNDGIILVVNGPDYARPFKNLAKELNFVFTTNPKVLDKEPENVKLVIFTGGEDVSPSLYNTPQYKRSYTNPHRDEEELEIYKKAKALDIPFAGICRGAQFLCVMAGGDLVQDVTGHGSNHFLNIRYPNGEVEQVAVNSSHHQMQLPFYKLKSGEDYQVVGWMDKPLSAHYALAPNNVIPADKADTYLLSEPDIVVYPKIKAFATQYHPEWLDDDHPGYIAYLRLIDAYLKPFLANFRNRTQTA
jgi:gamma-glutamyl-gamma-aminobutyrate hydrolase PuuD